jgi:hypothetical protein
VAPTGTQEPLRDVSNIRRITQDRQIGRPQGSRALVAALLVVAVSALLWQAGESHYRSCVEKAVVTSGISTGSGFLGPTEETRRRIDGCGRLPF